MQPARRFLPALLFHLVLLASPGSSAEYVAPTVPDVSRFPYPRITVTKAELARLRAAYEGAGSSARDVVAAIVKQADEALDHSIEFPPRGGQHNQWYQCGKCQLALKTIDATHHKCPKCSTVYSGEPYDDVIFSRIHSRNLNAMDAAAWAYAVTGEEKYARFAAKILLGYAERYRQYPYHSAGRGNGSWDKRAGGHLYEQTLTEASALANSIAPAYDLVASGNSLSDVERNAIEDGLLRPMLENIGKNRSGKSNWQTWHNAAMLAGGAVLGESSWIERAIADSGNGFIDQMSISVSDDGMWYENSWGYHLYTLSAMIHLAEYSRRLGIDLWSHSRLKSMFTLPVQYLMPDGRLPRFGDDTGASMGSISRALEFAYHAYGEPTMLPYLTKTPSWDSILLGREVIEVPAIPAVPSRVFPSAGHAILRTNGGDKGLVSVMTFGPYGGFHGHFDKLSFVFYGFGTELGVDPGRARSQAYRLPIHRNWYKATLSQNTVVVDGKSQSPAAGELLCFDASPIRSVAVARCSEAYKGVIHTRLLYQTQAYLLVFDDLQSDASHRYDWFYHDRGRFLDSSVACTPAVAEETDFPGMEYVQNARQGTTDEVARLSFASDKASNSLSFDASPGTKLLTGDGVGASVVDRVPLVRVTRCGKSARFAVVLEPVSGETKACDTSVAWRQRDGQIRIEVTRGGRQDSIVLDGNGHLLED